MYGYVAADNGPIADFDLSGERYAVGHDAVAAYHVVVGDMHVSHNQVVAADDGLAPEAVPRLMVTHSRISL